MRAKRAGIGAGLLLSAGLALAAGRLAGAQNPMPVDAQTVAEGKYLVAAADCAACHTMPGGKDFAGGVVIDTGFGKLLGSNITPDQDTGIGNWSQDDFVRAVKYGVGHGGHLYPGMPYIYFNLMPRDQILKMQAYLATVPAVNNRIVSNQLPFPFSIRAVMIGWNLLFFPNTGDYQPDPGQTAEWNRGAYLVLGPGHCAACHTSKNALGGDRTTQEFEGSVVDGLNAPALVNDTHNGLGLWTADDIGNYLKTGHNQYADAAGPMATVITHSTSLLTEADDKAIGVYVNSLHSTNEAAPAPLAATDAAMVTGGHIYAQECAACHTYGGIGVPRIIPALKGSPVVTAAEPVTIIRIIQHGGQSVDIAGGTAAAMPAFAGILDPQQIADVATYIRNAWGNAAAPVSVDKINTEASSP